MWYSVYHIHSFKNHFLHPRCCEQGLAWRDEEREEPGAPLEHSPVSSQFCYCRVR